MYVGRRFSPTHCPSCSSSRVNKQQEEEEEAAERRTMTTTQPCQKQQQQQGKRKRPAPLMIREMPCRELEVVEHAWPSAVLYALAYYNTQVGR